MPDIISDVTSLIQVKVANTDTNRTALGIVLEKGELLVAIDTGRLYYGDGDTTGGLLINALTEDSLHLLATEAGLGPQHSVTCSTLGAALVCDSTNSALFRKLTWSDLDSTGKLHPITSSHYGGNIESIYYTDFTSTYGAGYQIKSLYYSKSATGVYPLVSVKDATGRATLQFKQLSYDDLTGTPAVGTHAITAHTATANTMFYGNGSSGVSSFSTGTIGHALFSGGAGNPPTFRKILYSDISGALGTSVTAGQTLVSDGTQWVATGKWTVVTDTTDTTGALTSTHCSTLKFAINTYSTSIMFSSNEGSSNSKNTLVLDAYTAGIKQISFYTKTQNDSTNNYYPDMYLTKYGTLVVNGNSQVNSNTHLTGTLAGITISALTLTNSSTSLGRLTGLNINQMTYTNTERTATALGVRGISIAGISLDSANLDTTILYGIYVGSLASSHDTYGIYYTDMSSTYNSYGINFNSIHGDLISTGMKLHNITSSLGPSTGIIIDTVNGDTTSIGIEIKSLVGTDAAIGSKIITVDSTNSYAIGQAILNVDSVSSWSAGLFIGSSGTISDISSLLTKCSIYTTAGAGPAVIESNIETYGYLKIYRSIPSPGQTITIDSDSTSAVFSHICEKVYKGQLRIESLHDNVGDASGTCGMRLVVGNTSSKLTAIMIDETGKVHMGYGLDVTGKVQMNNNLDVTGDLYVGGNITSNGYIAKKSMYVSISPDITGSDGFAMILFPNESHINTVGFYEFDKDYLLNSVDATSTAAGYFGNFLYSVDSSGYLSIDELYDHIKNVDTLVLNLYAVDNDDTGDYYIKAIPPGYPYQRLTVLLNTRSDTGVNYAIWIKSIDDVASDPDYNVFCRSGDAQPVYRYSALTLIFVPFTNYVPYVSGSNRRWGSWIVEGMYEGYV